MRKLINKKKIYIENNLFVIIIFIEAPGPNYCRIVSALVILLLLPHSLGDPSEKPKLGRVCRDDLKKKVEFISETRRVWSTAKIMTSRVPYYSRLRIGKRQPARAQVVAAAVTDYRVCERKRARPILKRLKPPYPIPSVDQMLASSDTQYYNRGQKLLERCWNLLK